MAVNKRYVANNRQSLVLILNDPNMGQMTIEFKPGYGLRNEGYFLTNDPKVQQILEKDPRYNKSYRVDEIDNVPIAEYIARRTLNVPKDGGTKETVADEQGEKNPERKEFATAQEAKDWLNKEHAVPLNQITNKKKIVDKAIELGFKIEFVNDNN